MEAKIQISLNQLKNLLDQQKNIAVSSLKDIGGRHSFQKLRNLKVDGLEKELMEDVEFNILNCKYPNEYEVLNKYLQP